MAAGLPSTSAILADVRSRWGSDVLISFSRGKDAVATALALNEAGFRVSGLYYYSVPPDRDGKRSEEHTSELQSLMRISYAVFCLTKKTNNKLQEQNARKPAIII